MTGAEILLAGILAELILILFAICELGKLAERILARLRDRP